MLYLTLMHTTVIKICGFSLCCNRSGSRQFHAAKMDLDPAPHNRDFLVYRKIMDSQQFRFMKFNRQNFVYSFTILQVYNRTRICGKTSYCKFDRIRIRITNFSEP